MIPANISLAINGNILVLIIALIVAVAAGFFFYRYTLPRVPLSSRILFSMLRSLSLICLILMLFQPTLRFNTSSNQLPTVAILVDASQSMTLSDNSGSRSEIILQYLQSDALNGFPNNVQLKYYSFSSTLRSIPDILKNPISFSGEVTDIASSILMLKDSLLTQNISAVVLITDGNYTEGKNPIYTAEEISIPVFTVGVGDTTEKKDLVVLRAITNNITYANTKTPVDIRIKCSGYLDENVDVVLSEGSKILNRTTITLEKNKREYPVRLYFEPENEGIKKLTVKISKLPGEFTDKNNSQSFFVKVLRSKIRVLMIAGAPSPDVSAIRQSLNENDHFRVDAIIQKSSDEYYDSPKLNQLLDSADCMVSVGYPQAATSQKLLAQVAAAIEKRRVPLLFINAKNIDYTKLSGIAEYLPFSWMLVNNNEIFIRGVVPEKVKKHTLISLGSGIDYESWQKMPPVYKTKTIFKAKPESETILSCENPDIQNSEPLIGIRNINHHKVIGITGYGLWRWKLLSQYDERTEKLFSLFLNNSVRWLTTPDDNKKVRVVPVKEFHTTSEPVEFTAEVYDDQLRPVENASVIVRLHQGDETTLSYVGNGRYEGSFENLGSGDYSYIGIAANNDYQIGTDSGKFAVGQTNAEYIEIKMNKSLLQQIAFRTNGSYNDIEQVEQLSSEISEKVIFESKEIIKTDEIELWNWKYLAGLIIILFALEWFLRKRSGMI
ncbi:MAG: hypothetical protein HZB59_07645 [Ignavibacteriales bacterium]|nr:hypothetical protein [Ignavibacteriales bacterium]